MNLTEAGLIRAATATGFQTEPLEKALRLLELVETLRSHPFLKNRIALKGGTAINLFVFDAPRLSVDIDLNYIGATDRENAGDIAPELLTADSTLQATIREHPALRWKARNVREHRGRT